MKIIGLTGGIGSGKTTVSKMFSDLGIPIYIADIEAKKLTSSSKLIKKELINLLGEKAYTKGKINKKFIANLIFNNEDLLAKVNSIIHPRVAKHFNNWVKKQNAPYCIKEAAILFENEGYKNCDLNILITAPLQNRINRVLKRDSISIKEIEDRIKNQWTDEVKSELADFIIENIELKITQKKVYNIHLFLLKNQNN